MKDTLCNVKKYLRNAEVVLTKEHSYVKDLEQELKDLKSHLQATANASTLPPTTMVTAGLMMWVVIPTWSLPQPEAGPSHLPLPQPEARPSHLPPSQHETRPSSLPKEVNLGSWISMEVDDWEPEWLTEEGGFKLSDSPIPVSKRQQCKGLGPSTYISSFNSIEALKKNYLAQSPSNSLTNPAFCWEREGWWTESQSLWAIPKHRSASPGEPLVGFLWRPVPEHLASLCKVFYTLSRFSQIIIEL